ncbi:hypothetical protein E3T39_00915 [Cryobacterium suzukii]|uniref:Uncharacterized protein n=1 Tax=Cryobacterium suzukii TaxID=1259198 RepID=A0A4R9AIE2_9MICO|nr:hypothetical protein [Cryobacterium suzukii]TFD62545.1 hypothetical protein E3T39_00915 [Cryobacterium suzukii]
MTIDLGPMRGVLGQLTTPTVLLGLMCYTLNGEAGAAKRAAQSFLAGRERDATARFIGPKKAEARLMVTTAGTAAAFIWPLDSRKRALRGAFPRRGEDLRLLLNLDENELSSLRGVRNSLMHIDERMEELYLSDSFHLFSVWKITTDPVQGGNFMSWNPETEVLSFLDLEICVPNLIELLTLIEHRAWAAVQTLQQVFEEDALP